jgi:hypothetical protein
MEGGVEVGERPAQNSPILGQGRAGAESSPAAKHGRDRGVTGSGWPVPTEKVVVGMVGTDRVERLCSKDSGASVWKHATRSATAAARKRSCNAVISWQD